MCSGPHAPPYCPLQQYGEGFQGDLCRRPLLLACRLPEYQIVLQVKYSDRNNGNYKQLLVSATFSSKYIMYSPQFNLPSIPLRLMLPLSPCYGWRNWDTEGLSSLPQDSQLRTEGIRTQPMDSGSHVVPASHTSPWSIWLSPTAVLAFIITVRAVVIHLCGYLKWWLMWSLE